MTRFGKNIVWICVALVAIGFSFVLYPRKTIEKPLPSLNTDTMIIPPFPIVETYDNSVVPKEPEVVYTPYTVTGYYTQYDRINIYDGEFYGTSTCDAFIATKNDNPLTEYLAGLIRGQNTINSFTKEGYIRININLTDLSDAIRKKITNSSATNTIKIVMSERTTEGKDGIPCGSFVKILEK